MGKFRQFLTELSVRNISVFSFQDNNLGKPQCFFNKLDMCVDFQEVWLGITNGQTFVNC